LFDKKTPDLRALGPRPTQVQIHTEIYLICLDVVYHKRRQGFGGAGAHARARIPHNFTQFVG